MMSLKKHRIPYIQVHGQKAINQVEAEAEANITKRNQVMDMIWQPLMIWKLLMIWQPLQRTTDDMATTDDMSTTDDMNTDDMSTTDR